MTQTLTYDVRLLALELHALLKELDRVRWRDELGDAMRQRVLSLERRLARLMEARPSNEPLVTLRERLAEIRGVVQRHLPAENLPAPDIRDAWMVFRGRALPAYEALAASLRAYEVHVPSLRPTNYARNVFHVGSALLALVWIALVPSPTWVIGGAAVFFVAAWTMEATRRLRPETNEPLMRFFGPVAHPHEAHRVNSATWYCTALLALALTGRPLLATIGVAILGVADPAAALVGRRFGRTRLIHGRTLEGTLAFVVTGMLGGLLAVTLIHPGLGLADAAVLVAAGTVSGAITELRSLRVDDNLSIPVMSAAAAWVAAAWMALPLLGL